MDTKVLTEQLT